MAAGREAGRQHFPFTTGRDKDAELAKVLAFLEAVLLAKPRSYSTQATRQESSDSNVEPGLTGRDRALIILGQAPIQINPAMGPLDHPSCFDWNKSLGVLGTLSQFNSNTCLL